MKHLSLQESPQNAREVFSSKIKNGAARAANVATAPSYEWIQEVETVHTGGGIYNDVITLKSGIVIVLGCDQIGIYKTLTHFEEGDYHTLEEMDSVLK